jgi:hypothetical protein
MDDIPPIDETKNIGGATAVKDTCSLQWLSYAISQEAISGNISTQRDELTKLKEEQDKVRAMQELQQAIAVVGDDNSSISITPNLQTSLDKAKENGANIPEYKDGIITKEQRIDLQDRLRVAIENKNQDNDLRLQAISRITNVLHEMYALMRTIMRTQHDIYKTFIRKFDPRG